MSEEPGGTSGRDPRLEIPEVLRQPVKRPEVGSSSPGTVGTGLGEVGRALSIALDFLFTIGGAGALGWLLDRWQGWSPYGLMIGLGLGFLLATVRIIQRTTRDEAKSAKGAKRS